MNHHLQVPFRLLKNVPELACGKPGDGNLIIEGDNLVVLKALLPYCAGRKAEIAVDQIRAVSKERLGRRIDRLEAARAVRLRQIITEMYGE